MIRIGIAGIGFMGMIPYLAYQKVRGARVVAICSRNAKRRAGDWRGIRGNFGPAGEKMDLTGVRAYGRLDDLLADGEVDLVDLTLPPALHAGAAIAALASGKHVCCEKPLAMTAGECGRMIAAADKARRQLLVAHVLPFFPEYAWALAAVGSGKYGRLLGGSFRRVVAEPLWIKDYWSAEKTGGPMLDLHVHDAHFIRLLFGMPRGVVTRGTTHRQLPKFWHSLFDFGEGGPVVEATSGTIDQQGRPFVHGFEIRLEGATLAFEFAVAGGEGQYLCPPTIFDGSGKAKAVKLAGGEPMDAFVSELGEAVRCAGRNETSTILAPELARDAVKLCHKQAASLASGRPVRI
jgi:predicted dehydrogenase